MAAHLLALIVGHVSCNLAGAVSTAPAGWQTGADLEAKAGWAMMRREGADETGEFAAQPLEANKAGQQQQGAIGVPQLQNVNPNQVVSGGTPGVYYYNPSNPNAAASAAAGAGAAGYPVPVEVPVPVPCPGEEEGPYHQPRRRYPNPYGGMNPAPSANPYAPSGQSPTPSAGPASTEVTPGLSPSGSPIHYYVPQTSTECKSDIAGTYTGLVPSGRQAEWTISQTGCTVVLRAVPDEGQYSGNVATSREGVDQVHVAGPEGTFDGLILENGDLNLPAGPGILAKQSSAPATNPLDEDLKDLDESEKEQKAEPEVQEAEKEAETAAEETASSIKKNTEEADAEEEFVGMTLSDEEKQKVGAALFAAFILGVVVSGVGFSVYQANQQSTQGGHPSQHQPDAPQGTNVNVNVNLHEEAAAPAAEAATADGNEQQPPPQPSA